MLTILAKIVVFIFNYTFTTYPKFWASKNTDHPAIPVNINFTIRLSKLSVVQIIEVKVNKIVAKIRYIVIFILQCRLTSIQ